MDTITESLERSIQKHAASLTNSVTKVKTYCADQDFAQDAFAAGNRDFYKSEDQIEQNYRSLKNEVRDRGLRELNEMLAEMNTAIDRALKLDPQKAAEAQTILTLIRDDQSLLRLISEPQNRNDFTTLSAAANKTDISSNVAVSLRVQLDVFETSLTELVRKAEKYITKALNDDKTCASCWLDWVYDALDDVKKAYQNVQKVIDNKPVEISTIDRLAKVMEQARERA